MVNRLLLQKNGYVISLLAKEFLSMDIGDKIRTIRDYAEDFSVGNGTVQVALKKLIDVGAVDVMKKGHKGSFITNISYDLLSELAGINSMAGVMPLPSSKKYEGLATGIFETLNKGSVNVSLAFMTGAKSRIESLIQGRYHFAIVSKHSYNYYKGIYDSITLVHEFGEYSFVSGHVLLYRKDTDLDSKKLKIGIDKTSYDQMSITKDYFQNIPSESNLIDIRLSSITDSLLKRKIDVAIWSKDNLKYKIKGIVEKEVDILNNDTDITNACLVVADKNQFVIKYISELLKVDKIREIQNQVINELRAPNY